MSKPSAVDELLKRDWILAEHRQHPFGLLQGKRINSHRIVVLLGEKNRVGARYFQLFLKNDSGDISRQPVVIGLHSSGNYPAYNWIEIMGISTKPSLGPREKAPEGRQNGLAQRLLGLLADLIPPGGHIMVEYESPEWQDTARSLVLGIPPATTSLGYLLFSIGCGAGFKDWYFAESGTEGPRKLQGYKALNAEHARQKSEELAGELTSFLSRPYRGKQSALFRAVRNRARQILKKLG